MGHQIAHGTKIVENEKLYATKDKKKIGNERIKFLRDAFEKKLNVSFGQHNYFQVQIML